MKPSRLLETKALLVIAMPLIFAYLADVLMFPKFIINAPCHNKFSTRKSVHRSEAKTKIKFSL